MSGGRRGWLALTTTLVLACAVLGSVSRVCSESRQGSHSPGGRVLFPPDRGVILAGSFNIIAQGMQGELKVDGQPQPWEAYEPAISLAKVALSPGLHELRIGNRKIEFSVGLSEEEHEGPKEWPVFRHHTIPSFKRCSVCHETSRMRERTLVGPVRTPSACFACHREADFQSAHKVPVKAAEHCQECHDLHGSPRKALLKPGASLPKKR